MSLFIGFIKWGTPLARRWKLSWPTRSENSVIHLETGKTNNKINGKLVKSSNPRYDNRRCQIWENTTYKRVKLKYDCPTGGVVIWYVQVENWPTSTDLATIGPGWLYWPDHCYWLGLFGQRLVFIPQESLFYNSKASLKIVAFLTKDEQKYL